MWFYDAVIVLRAAFG